ncbi:tannase/feruloyl esterase family alpha/beta hydrolase [Xenophilus arseniciresistens]|uniref:Tannase/feruloyl esterase family alpha/beta hydrolase n=1 Tax=Xenophilus arseniciresistens TaxID=1283306 RepID=A0AAE3N5W0_9BURK|nr:tannase/feruloyl esterase family alpha/beta hydrolase [Xenophilus arseniciresistens]MDA7415448.1 tannase/feruloyl esterase family alpha/beta hydrolase [Xenophilus arseniciresistens]
MTSPRWTALAAALALAACGHAPQGAAPALAEARPGPLQQCEALARGALPAGTRLTRTQAVAAAPATGTTPAVPAHCLVQGQLHERSSPVDGQRYAIGFELRLPQAWNGRFFHQVNGGLDGAVVPAMGAIGGGAPTHTALQQGFAVVSSDAGHSGAQNPRFGLDPQARINYGYGAVAQLTPVAKQLIASAYGRGPDRSYIGGCSNGGRHAMVAAARLPGEYDGVLAGNPGFNLPRAAVAQLWGAQQWAPLATARTPQGQPELQSAFTPAQLAAVAQGVRARCDALDGLADGIVSDVKACQAQFDLMRDVPGCTPGASSSGSNAGSACLAPAQKEALARVFAGARNSRGQPVYSSFPFDPGITGQDWRSWKFAAPATRDAAAVAFIFATPPMHERPQGLDFALGFDMDRDAPSIGATAGLYTESALDFMLPPAGDLQPLRQRGARMIVYHGTADGVFSSDDTARWWTQLDSAHQGRAASFARYFPVPAMNHCRGGPATDQFDLLTPLVDWVERGVAPQAVPARARGAGTASPNPEVPADWSPTRSRPLCAWPAVARYRGGDPELAASFACSPS